MVERFCRHIDQRSTPDSNPGTEATGNAGDPRGFRTEYFIRICNVQQVPETMSGGDGDDHIKKVRYKTWQDLPR